MVPPVAYYSLIAGLRLRVQWVIPTYYLSRTKALHLLSLLSNASYSRLHPPAMSSRGDSTYDMSNETVARPIYAPVSPL